MNFNLIAPDGTAQLRLEDHKFGAVIHHRGIEEFHAARAVAAGFIERDGSLLKDSFGRQPACDFGDTDRSGQEVFLTLVEDGPRHGLEKRIGKGFDIPALRVLMEEQGELIAREPGDGVGRTDFRLEPVADDREQRVARLMTHRVIYHLEAVEVEQEHEQASGLAIAGGLDRA